MESDFSPEIAAHLLQNQAWYDDPADDRPPARSLGKHLRSCIKGMWSCLFGDVFPLSDLAFSSFVIEVAEKSVSGLVALSSFGATYFLAWAKKGSVCMKNGPNVMQGFFVSLPFILYLLALFISGTAKAARYNPLLLGRVAAFALFEVISFIAMGGALSICMSRPSPWNIGALGTVLIITVVFGWGLLFRHPKNLRRFVWSTCCCQTDQQQMMMLSKKQKIH